MRRIALTGNAAAGKSTVAALLRGWGVTVIDADAIVHELQAPGAPLLRAIATRFGQGVLRPDGSLDRGRLRALVLGEPARRLALEALVHPAVAERREQLEAEAAAKGIATVVHDIPLLFEAMDPGAFDAVLLVDAPEALRRRRLAERGLAPHEVEQLLAAQRPPAEKRRWRGGPRDAPALLIENDGDLATLEARTRAAWEAALG